MEKRLYFQIHTFFAKEPCGLTQR